MAHKVPEEQFKGEGRLTTKLLRQKLQRGKGPLVRLGSGLSKQARESQDIRQGLR